MVCRDHGMKTVRRRPAGLELRLDRGGGGSKATFELIGHPLITGEHSLFNRHEASLFKVVIVLAKQTFRGIHNRAMHTEDLQHDFGQR